MADALSDTPFTLLGPWRAPRQMLAEQEYGGHLSVHDDEAATKLGLAGAPIEGPTHFSQFEPLVAALWGARWFTHGCLSAHFQTMVVEGEDVRASVEAPGPGATAVRIDAAKSDGSPVLTGTASVGPDHGTTELDARLRRVRAPERLVILDQLAVGQRGAGSERVRLGPDTVLSPLYPFSLRQKLAAITERLTWHDPDAGASSPWGRAVLPMEMVSVLALATSGAAGFRVRQPSLGLFIDEEIRLLGEPVFVDEDYELEREVVALSESRRTESYWTRTTVVRVSSGTPVAEVLLHQGVFKDSYPDYPTA